MTSDTNCSEKPNNSKPKRIFKRLVKDKKDYYSIIYEKDGEEYEGYSSYSLDVISDFLKEYFLQEPRTSDDLISRQEIIDLLSDYKDRFLGALDCMDIVGIERRIIESCLEFIEACIKDIESLDHIVEVSKKDILRSLVSSKNPDILNLQENKFKDNLFDIHNVTQNSKDYPSSVMDIVPNKNKYHLISINGLIVMPLFEFINYIKGDNKSNE